MQGLSVHDTQVIGYTTGNDVSSRDIDGKNPLYLPQAKCYDGACALGPCLLVSEMPTAPSTPIDLRVVRDAATVFEGSMTLAQIDPDPATSGLLPPSAVSRPEQRIDDRHVSDGVLEAHGHTADAAYGLRETFALKPVLVERRQGDRFSTVSAELPAVIDDDPTCLVLGRAERKGEFDAPLTAEHLHALVRHQLHRAREGGLS